MSRRRVSVCACLGCPAHPGSCPTLTDSTRCPPCARTTDRARGSRQQRGYGSDHDRLRKQWAPQVATGTVRCARCPELIQPEQPWDLGHTDDRTAYTGPEHAICNRRAGGQVRHRGGA